MDIRPLKDEEFNKFKALIYKLAGINLSEEKKALVSGRLQKRLRFYSLFTYNDYYSLVTKDNPVELQMMVDLLTTNETYFYREPDHFDFLAELAKKWPAKSQLRIWSGACSSGEEAYTCAFVLSENMQSNNWEIVGTDISEKVLAKAQNALYPIARADNIPKPILRKYCLKGVRSQIGTFRIQDELRKKVSFRYLNLLEDMSSIGKFDIIFLRNVMIYFDRQTRQKVIEGIIGQMNPDAYLILGHAESLLGVTTKVKTVRPTIYKFNEAGA